MGKAMGFWSRLFGGRRKSSQTEEQEIEYDEWDSLQIRSSQIEMDDIDQREKYARFLMEQIKEAEKTMQALGAEYNIVTAYLKDMDELESLPKSEKAELLSCASSLNALEQSKENNPLRLSRMGDELYHRVGRMESEIEEGIRKIREAEEYQELVHKDLKRLEAERDAYDIRRRELTESLNNTRSVSVICIMAMALCMAALLIFQFALNMDCRIGYLLTGLITAGILTFVFVRFKEADSELAKVHRSINRLILLQNRVKIRYVNNTNLLDYLCLKYEVESAKELEDRLQLFYEEREERRRYMQVLEDMDYYQKELLKILKRYQLYDPIIWIHQAAALLDSKEMVETRHDFISRRQKLRKQMEQNQKLAENAQEEIRLMTKRYPGYAARLLEIVNEYE